MATKIALVATLAVLAHITVVEINAQDVENMYTNLRVLPEGISRNELNRIMLGNLRGLGLPRRQNEGCLYCHVGDMEVPVGEWDFASDDKPMKQKARVMMSMVAEINGRHLTDLEDRVAPELGVTCYTCHAGRTDPRPIEDVLQDAYTAGGVDSLINRYVVLRERYFAADAYDFRPVVLSAISTGIADLGHFDDALRVAALNSEHFPNDADARRNWLRIELEKTHAASGIAAALGEFETLRSIEPPRIVDWQILDWMGWRLWRKEQRDDAAELFTRNLAMFPNEYVPNESMASVVRFSGDLDGAIEIYENWLRQSPDHEMARRQLTNLRARRERQRD